MGFIDAEDDLGLVPFDQNYANHNTTGLNTFFETWGSGINGNHDILTIPGKIYFINNTIKTPSKWGGRILGAGIGDELNWTSYTNGANLGGAATQFVWYGGPTGVPMMQVRGGGLTIDGICLNGIQIIFGSDYTGTNIIGSGISSGVKPAYGIALYNELTSQSIPGKVHIPQISISNCDVGMTFGLSGIGSHADNCLIGHYQSKENREAIQFQDRQANGFNIQYLEYSNHRVDANSNSGGSYVIHCKDDEWTDPGNPSMAGGAISCQNLKINSPVTVLRLSGPTSNGSMFVFNNIKFDNNSVGWRLVTVDRPGHLYLKMYGWAGNTAYFAENPINIPLVGSFTPQVDVDINIFGVGTPSSGKGLRYYYGPNLTQSLFSGIAQLCPSITSTGALCAALSSGASLINSINTLQSGLNTVSGIAINHSGSAYAGISQLCTGITSVGALCSGLQGIQGEIGPSGLQGPIGLTGPTGVFNSSDYSGIVFTGLQNLCPLVTSISYICNGLSNSGTGTTTIINSGTTIIVSGGVSGISALPPFSGIFYSGMLELCPSACSSIQNICDGFRVLCFTPEELLDWYDLAIMPLRILINDFTNPYEYNDATLIDLLTTSANYVIQEVNLENDYIIDVNSRTISPDPSADQIFMNFMVLKAACLTNVWTFKQKAIAEGLRFRLNQSEFSQFAGKDIVLSLITEGPCKSYEELVSQANFGNSDGIRVVLSPFISNNFIVN